MTMAIILTPEEKFDKNLWYVLQKVKVHMLQANDPEHSAFLYLVQFDKTKNPPDAIPPKDEISLIKKLAKDYKALRIINGSDSHEVVIDPKDLGEIAEKMSAQFAEEIISLQDDEATLMDNQRYTRPFWITIINPSFDKLYEEQYNKIKRAIRSTEKLARNRVVRVSTKSGWLAFNKKSGGFILNQLEGHLNPKSQEAKTLSLLMDSDEHQFTYAEFLGEEKAGKISERRKLAFVIRNLKETLGILPSKKAKNKDVIKNLKDVGYRLILKAEPKHIRGTIKP